jgi:hypothetical protein
MPFVSLSRIAAYIVASIAAAMLLVTQIVAQPSGTVDCNNGFYCPRDNACLVGGLCGRVVDAVPGAVRTSTGTWCDPGFRESKFKPGGCVPGSYTECSATVMCAPGDTCGTDGDCHAATTPKGPTCGKLRCHEGRICASTGRCMNTAYFQDCGNGTICSKHAGCEHPTGCVLVGPKRTKQIKKSR